MDELKGGIEQGPSEEDVSQDRDPELVDDRDVNEEEAAEIELPEYDEEEFEFPDEEYEFGDED